ncbi:hypothetical protein PLICRDRAFT_34135 [Plicaturopsis crispa FD-325 SS-3]|nr:hypothetical protein PLICRDRAFT_34135 [Plicaturopsis crispa FD-325 SS-3]
MWTPRHAKTFASHLRAIVTVGLLAVLYFASIDTSRTLSPQGCRMSWMSPSYILQSGFDTTWSPLARRYSLWLYREVGWESNEVKGVPVLFIPGNAGSSHQVRSIASSATRQFYSSPYVKAPEFEGTALKQLDFFAVEFNEDLSAFHGPTLDAQISYSSSAISYILSLYPTGTTIIVLGHSMGGIVATSLLPTTNISAIITMSTPHTLPPARFDSRIDKLYTTNRQTLLADNTPILSLCGGATDMMIPSESCILPPAAQSANDSVSYRRTVFTSALEGAWTGVGHREMVWCHQVRWRVARAALELGLSQSPEERGVVLDRWLRDGHRLPPSIPTSSSDLILGDPGSYDVLEGDARLEVRNLRGSRMYLLPLPASSSATEPQLVLYVSGGSIPPISPHHHGPLQVSVYTCRRQWGTSDSDKCTPLSPSSLKLIPSPVPGKAFPVPDEGFDESEGVVLFEASVLIARSEPGEEMRIGVRIEHGDGSGWIVGGFVPDGATVRNDASSIAPFLGTLSVSTGASGALRSTINFPNLLSNALVVYRLTPTMSSASNCLDTLLHPLLMHTSQPSEAHYYPLALSRPIHLHSHSSAPYIPDIRPLQHRGLDLTIYASGCHISEFDITVDWWATIGRWGTRYHTTLASWAVGVVAIMLFRAWGIAELGRPVPSVDQSLATLGSIMPMLAVGSFAVSFLPLPAGYYLGSRGEPLFAFLAPILLFLAFGLVGISWWTLRVFIWPLGKLGRAIGRRKDNAGVNRGTFVSMGLIFALIFLFIPWQVAFLGCWIIHLSTCATSTQPSSFPGSSRTPGTTPPPVNIPLKSTSAQDDPVNSPEPSASDVTPPRDNYDTGSHADNSNHNVHLLLLMTWLLPLAAPVLAVWVRTLITAGLTTPFDGDHNFLNIAPFLLLVDFASWYKGPLYEKKRFEQRISIRWAFLVLAAVAFFPGPSGAYRVFDAANCIIALILLVRIGPRYWGGKSFGSIASARVP